MSGDPGGLRDIVLVVDDTPETLGFLTEALERAGHTAPRRDWRPTGRGPWWDG